MSMSIDLTLRSQPSGVAWSFFLFQDDLGHLLSGGPAWSPSHWKGLWRCQKSEWTRYLSTPFSQVLESETLFRPEPTKLPAREAEHQGLGCECHVNLD